MLYPLHPKVVEAVDCLEGDNSLKNTIPYMYIYTDLFFFLCLSTTRTTNNNNNKNTHSSPPYVVIMHSTELAFNTNNNNTHTYIYNKPPFIN
jgi:hypothetical protein